jgi:hypothetical protein
MGTPLRRFLIPFGSLKGGAYLIGERGGGKTTLLNNWIVSIVKNPRLFGATSIVLLDPHGDQTLQLLQSIPDPSKARVYDPYRAPFCTNMLELPTLGLMPREQIIELVVGTQSEAFAQALNLSSSKAPRAMAICRAMLAALVTSRDDATWLDVYRMNKIIMQGDPLDSITRRFHLNRNAAETLSPIVQNSSKLIDTMFALHYRLDTLVQSETLRRTFCSRRSTVNFHQIIKPANLSLFRFSSTEVPVHVQSIAFANIIMRLWCTALERAYLIPEPEQRSPIFLVLDEFQIVAQLTILEVILAQLRKASLHPIFSHQNLAQLTDRLAMSILTNTAVQVAFASSAEDARKLAQNFDPYRAEELAWTIAGQTRHEAVCRVRWGDEDMTPIRIMCPPPPPPLRSMNEVTRILSELKQKRLLEISRLEKDKLPKWTTSYDTAGLPAPSLWPIIVALIMFDKEGRTATLTALSTSGLNYIPHNKYRLAEILQQATMRGVVESTQVGERTVFQLSEPTRQKLFAYTSPGSEAKAGLSEHRNIKQAIEHRYAQMMYCPVPIEEKETQEDPDSILLKPSEDQDAWDPWTATALEAEVWPEKHPERVAWHVHNDLDNLEFARVLFAVADDAKRDSLLKILTENCYSHLDRISVETIAATQQKHTNPEETNLDCKTAPTPGNCDAPYNTNRSQT